MPRKLDLIGKRFGKLIVTRSAGVSIHGKTLWECACDCGNTKTIVGGDLQSGRTTSCGCHKDELARQRQTKHGMRHSRIYHTWIHMNQRCNNPKDQDFNDYGGRGIQVCERWHSFGSFYEDMKVGYSDNLTIDRIDVNGDYCKENCRWVDPVTQANNKRNNRVETIDGITDTVANLCRRYNVEYMPVIYRLYLGWNIDDAIKIPVKHKTS